MSDGCVIATCEGKRWGEYSVLLKDSQGIVTPRVVSFCFLHRHMHDLGQLGGRKILTGESLVYIEDAALAA
jgi:hypothetical protein